MTPRPLPQRPEGGFTLVEIIASIVLVAVGMVSVIALQGSNFRASGDVKNMQVRTRAAVECAEQILGVRETDGYVEVGTGISSSTGAIRFGAQLCDTVGTDIATSAGTPTVSFDSQTGTGCPANYSCKRAIVAAPVTSTGGTVTLTLMLVNY